MKKLLMISLISLALVSCATSPKFAYDIEKPKCQPGEIIKWCWTGFSEAGDEYTPITDGSPCPDGGVPASTEIKTDCFRLINHYIGELEIRNESCK